MVFGVLPLVAICGHWVGNGIRTERRLRHVACVGFGLTNMEQAFRPKAYGILLLVICLGYIRHNPLFRPFNRTGYKMTAMDPSFRRLAKTCRLRGRFRRASLRITKDRAKAWGLSIHVTVGYLRVVAFFVGILGSVFIGDIHFFRSCLLLL